MNFDRGARAWHTKHFEQAAHSFDMAIQVEPTQHDAIIGFGKPARRPKAVRSDRASDRVIYSLFRHMLVGNSSRPRRL